MAKYKITDVESGEDHLVEDTSEESAVRNFFDRFIPASYDIRGIRAHLKNDHNIEFTIELLDEES